MTAPPQGENWLDSTLGAHEYLAAIVDSSDDAIIGKTLDGIVRSWNRGAERLYGYAADEMLGRPIAQIIPPELPDELPAIMARLARGEHVEHYETIRVAKDGRRVDVSVSISPIADAGGRIVGAAAIARDISERKRAERERELLQARVREAEARYRGLFESAADAILVADAEGRYRDANPAASELLGYARDELLRLGVADVVAATPAWGRAEYDRFVQAGRWRGELELRRKDGTLVPVEARATVLSSPTDPSYVSVVRDLTERKRAEERLRFLADAGARLPSTLDVEETLHAVARAAVSTLADWSAVYLADDGGTVGRPVVAHRDPGKEALVEELGRRYPLEPSDGSPLRQVLETGEPALVSIVSDEPLVRAARASDHLALLRDLGPTSALWVPLVADGRILGVLGLFSAEPWRRYGPDDLTLAGEVARRAALAVDNARLYRESQEALRVRDEFLSIASHELRTPVTTVKGTAQMLLRALERGRLDGARLERALRAIVGAGGRLTELTDDLLDVSRQRTGLFVLRPRRLDLGALAREVADRQRDLLTERHPLTVVAEDGCVVEADRYRLEHILTNLLENAAKYSPDGGPIQVAVRPDGDGALLEVQDTGIGLPAGAAEAIFEPFGRAANAVARQIPGLGLGLHIARDVVGRHGGRIWAESAGEGRGTTLRIRLPGAPSKAAEAPASG